MKIVTVQPCMNGIAWMFGQMFMILERNFVEEKDR